MSAMRNFCGVCAGVGYGLAVGWVEPVSKHPVLSIVLGLVLALYVAFMDTGIEGPCRNGGGR